TGQKKALIVVDQEPIRPPGDQEGDPVAIYWGLDDSLGDQAQYVWFDDSAIDIKGTGSNKVTCKKLTDFVFRCTYNRPKPETEYKYKIQVWDKQAKKYIKDLDPTVMN